MQVIQESEFIVLLIGIGVVVFLLLNWKHLKPPASRRILLLSFSALIVGWILTILEGFFLEDLLNLLEHSSFAISAILLVIWCWSEFRKKEGEF
ncbi:MAG: hypothetical protein ACXAEF_14295 [Candidatus Thorarchaeota archaeon]|jgi:hypothetical protein